MKFSKYQGTGNDFIIIDNRLATINLSKEKIAKLCDRRFGIGADGLMLLELAEGYDFAMKYYNSDGCESTMCGNGGRCLVAYAKRLNMIDSDAHFLAIDGPHKASIDAFGLVKLHMADVSNIRHEEGYSVLNTGSPHYVAWVDDVAQTPVFSLGKQIRNLPEYQPDGINVNFVQLQQQHWLYVRTYERGVEEETLSCGTGVTAAAIASTMLVTGEFETPIITPGGILKVNFNKPDAYSANNVVLTGPAVWVFDGEIPEKA